MRTQLLAFITLATLSVEAQVRTVPAETAIQQITVFASGAQVQRTATVAVLPGHSEIQFAGLSNQLDQQSVQLKADANITLLSVQTNRDFLSERKMAQDERNLLDRQASWKEKADYEARMLEVYKQEEVMLVKNQAIGGTAGVKAADLEAALNLQRQRMADVYQKQLEAQKRLREAQLQSERIGQQLQEVSRKKDSVSYSVIALIESKETRSIRFTLTYTVRDAGWYPTYDVRVGDVGKPIDLVMSANVFQRSGETWKDVSLLLSTGNPTDNATPSQLEPWMLQFYDPNTAWMRSRAVQPGVAMGRITNENNEPLAGVTIVIQGTNKGTSTDANGFFKLQNLLANAVAVISYVGYESKTVPLKPGYLDVKLKTADVVLNEVVVAGYGTADKELQGSVAGVSVRGRITKAMNAKEEQLQTVGVTTNYKPTTTVYQIDDKYTLETDGKTTTINIRKVSVPVVFEYYAAPKLDPAAFLTAKLPGWQELDLQPGEANLFFEGTYLGKTYLDLANAGDTLSLALGKDNSIRIQRKLVKEQSARKFIGSSRTEEKLYEISVRNTKRISVSLVLQDQFPIAINKEIEVDDRRAPEAQIDKDTGIATWSLTLQPGEEQKLRIGYSVKYPKDKKVVLE